MILSLRDSDIADKYRTEQQYQIAYNLLDMLGNEQISIATKLPIEEVEHIRAEYNSTKGQ